MIMSSFAAHSGEPLAAHCHSSCSFLPLAQDVAWCSVPSRTVISSIPFDSSYFSAGSMMDQMAHGQSKLYLLIMMDPARGHAENHATAFIMLALAGFHSTRTHGDPELRDKLNAHRS